MADIIRSRLRDAEGDDPRQLERVAVFSRKAADILARDDPSFSYDWFFGACGLDNWGELFSLSPSGCQPDV
jgi:hypothetical protein